MASTSSRGAFVGGGFVRPSSKCWRRSPQEVFPLVADSRNSAAGVLRTIDAAVATMARPRSFCSKGEIGDAEFPASETTTTLALYHRECQLTCVEDTVDRITSIRSPHSNDLLLKSTRSAASGRRSGAGSGEDLRLSRSPPFQGRPPHAPRSSRAFERRRYQHDRSSGRLLHADQYATICPKALRWLLPWCFRDNERCPAGPLSH